MFTELEPSKRYPTRYRAPNGVTIGFKWHALKRLGERGIDVEEMLNRLRGVPLRSYKSHGVVAELAQRGTFLRIITVWNV